MADGLTTSYASESGHWYTRTGKPAYEITGKNGVVRATTLRDAKQLKLVPSVSTISSLAARPGLEWWKQEQRMLASLTLPRKEEETEAEWLNRIRLDAQEQAKRAAERGTAIHGAIERFIGGQEVESEWAPYVTATIELCGELLGGPLMSFPITSEHSFAHPLGFGGKLDLVVAGDAPARAVIDFKCKEFTAADLQAGKKLAWDEHCMQLAAYRFGTGMVGARCINVFVSRNDPGVVSYAEWDEDQLERGLDMFRALLNFYFVKARYCAAF